MYLWKCICLSIVLLVSTTLANPPPMGYNTWNVFACNISETLILNQAKAMYQKGLVAAGYTYMNLDDCWQLKNRDAQGNVVPDPDKFPRGIAPLANDLWNLYGMHLGIYTDVGLATCQGRAGSYNYYEQDTKQYAEWGVAYVKADYCNLGDVKDPRILYDQFGLALSQAYPKQNVFFSQCDWGTSQPWLGWAREACHGLQCSWRVSGDIKCSWGSVMSNLEVVAPKSVAEAGGNGGYNDPDMLEVDCLPLEQFKSHFAMWCLVSSPLLIGSDVPTLEQERLEVLQNPELIFINQDDSTPGYQLSSSSALGTQTWVRKMSDGDWVVAFLNAGYLEETLMHLQFSDLGFYHATARDVINNKDVGKHTSDFAIQVHSKSVQMIRFTPIQ